MLEVAFQFLPQIGESLQIFKGAPHAALGLTAPLLVLGDPRRFLNEDPQFLWFGLNQPGNHALLNDRVASGPQPRAQEQIGDVPSPAFAAVQPIFRRALSTHHPAHGYFRVGGIFPHQLAGTVVENQFYGCLAHRLPLGGAVKDDIGHGFATEVLGRTLAHDPAHGINNVGFTTAIGPDYGAHIAGKVDRSGVNKGFETRELDGL